MVVKFSNILSTNYQKRDQESLHIILIIMLVRNFATVLRRSVGAGPDVQENGMGSFTYLAGGLVAIVPYCRLVSGS